MLGTMRCQKFIVIDDLATTNWSYPTNRRSYRTGRPVTVRPMTRRWISDVPSKIVKILECDMAPQVGCVYAGKSAHGGLVPRLSLTESDSVRRIMLPVSAPREAIR